MQQTEDNRNGRNSDGTFGKGNTVSMNRGPNKISIKVRSFLISFLEANIENVQESFDQLKPLEKLQFIANVLPYVVPKLQSVESDNKTNITGGITIRWEEPDVQAGQNKSSVSDVQSIQSGGEDNNKPGRDEIDEDL